VRPVFRWGGSLAGVMYLALQVPQIPRSPLFGWLRDHIGTWLPTTVGFFFLTPIFLLLGLPGNHSFPWAAGNTNTGQMISVASIACVGILISLLHGVGSMESKRECSLSTLPSRYLQGPVLRYSVQSASFKRFSAFYLHSLLSSFSSVIRRNTPVDRPRDYGGFISG
jgi:hypothetical protein